ncbi:MAG: hypothetical protein AAF589_05190, partial [Planctomycetota bacterium]
MNVSAAAALAAIDRTQQRFAAWKNYGRITDRQLEEITAFYDQMRAELDPAADHASRFPDDDSGPLLSPQERGRRRELLFVAEQVRRHGAAQRLTPGAADACLREIESEIAALGSPGPETERAATGEQGGRKLRGWVDLLLDPRALQGLMACGGALLVLGLVIWLALIGVFDNPLVVAGVMGAASVGTLAAGVLVVRNTRYQLAGRALTHLACLALPLNLWFYDAQGLITLENGGQLWLPALVICFAYAGAARLLRDAWLVYTLVAGVAMTGLLFLADGQVQRFWEVLSPSAFLVGLGLVAIHAERLFAPGDGDFGRENFGKAFFRAGHVALMSGLAVLMGGRLVGRFYAWFEPLGVFALPDVAVETGPQFYALGLVAAATYAYGYSQLVVDRRGAYAYPAIFTLIWAQVIALGALAVPVSSTMVLATGFAEAATLFGLLAWSQRGRQTAGIAAPAFAAICECVAVWQTLVLFGFVAYAPLVALGGVGVGCLALARWMSRGADESVNNAQAGVVSSLGAGLVYLGAGAGVLLAGNRLLADEVRWPLVGLLLGQTLLTALAALLANRGTRCALNVLAVGSALACAATLNTLSLLGVWQRVELITMAGGTALLAMGHRGWRKEGGTPNAAVGVNLALGSLMVAAPGVVALVLQRLLLVSDNWVWALAHEVGVLAIGLALLGAGVLCRIRSTTLAGAATLLAYVGSLALLIDVPDQLQSVAVYMMVGGGAFFGTAVLLSV